MRKITLALLFSTCLSAQYNNVYLAVSAPKEWEKEIVDSLTSKLNAIPDVQVVNKADDAAFTLSSKGPTK